MNEKAEILKNIVNSELLAPSLVVLSRLLGYKTKSSVYRISKGEAKNTAMGTFCRLLRERLYINDKALGQMGVLLQDYDYLSSRLKHEPVGNDAETVVVSLITGDYSQFSQRFVEEVLPEIMRYRHEMPVGFYRVLFYYYVKKSVTNFYVNKTSYKGECDRVLLPLANRLLQLYPENYQGKEYYTDVLDKDQSYVGTPPTLWNCIETGGKLLMYYASSDSYQNTLSSFLLLPGVEERSYWLTDNPEQIVMALAIEGKRKRSGFYAVFRLNLKEDSLQWIGLLTFYPDGLLQVYDGNVYKVGRYKYTSRVLSLNLYDGSNPLNVGKCWRLMNIDTIPVILEFNEKLDDLDIRAAMLRGQGIEDMEDYVVKDVLLTRSEVRLRLVGGKELVISRDAYDFLGNIHPTDTVVVARRIKDGFEYVAWTDYNHIIPLSEFRVE